MESGIVKWEKELPLVDYTDELEELFQSLKTSQWGAWAFARAVQLLCEYKPTPEVLDLIERGFFKPEDWREELAEDERENTRQWEEAGMPTSGG